MQKFLQGGVQGIEGGVHTLKIAAKEIKNRVQ
jgi:hypothetical protein